MLESHPGRCLKDIKLWHLGTWFSGALGTAGGMVGLNNLRGLFQPKQFCVPLLDG